MPWRGPTAQRPDGERFHPGRKDRPALQILNSVLYVNPLLQKNAHSLVRGTYIYMTRTDTSCHLPNQSTKTSRFIHYLDELLKPENREITWTS
jgi:hypothetical protein